MPPKVKNPQIYTEFANTLSYLRQMYGKEHSFDIIERAVCTLKNGQFPIQGLDNPQTIDIAIELEKLTGGLKQKQ